jgi:hypothetical protein
MTPRWTNVGVRDSWVARGVAVFAAYAAPIVLSGEATIAAYMSQIDNATYLGITDRFLEHGHVVPSVSASP